MEDEKTIQTDLTDINKPQLQETYLVVAQMYPSPICFSSSPAIRRQILIITDS